MDEGDTNWGVGGVHDLRQSTYRRATWAHWFPWELGVGGSSFFLLNEYFYELNPRKNPVLNIVFELNPRKKTVLNIFFELNPRKKTVLNIFFELNPRKNPVLNNIFELNLFRNTKMNNFLN